MLRVYATDAQLAARVVDGDSDAFGELAERYARIIDSNCRRWRPVGLVDHSDLHQAGLIGLWNACPAHRPLDVFAPLAVTCIRRSIGLAIRDAGAGKHRVTTDAVRLEAPVDDTGEDTFGDLFPSTFSIDPYLVVVAKERLRLVLGAKLTPGERKAVAYRLGGCVPANPRSAAQALMTARRKIKVVLADAA